MSKSFSGLVIAKRVSSQRPRDPPVIGGAATPLAKTSGGTGCELDVARLFPLHRILEARQKRLLRLGEVHTIDAVGEVGRADIGELRFGELVGHLAERERLPIAGEELVRSDRRSVLQSFHLGFDVGKHAMKARFGDAQRIRISDGALQRHRRRQPGSRREASRHDPPQRRDTGPSRHAVIRDVEQPTGFQTLADQRNERAPVLCADPAENAVHRHDVELRRRRVGGDLLEARFAEDDIREPGGLCQGAGVGDVAGVEVDAEHLHGWIGSGDQIRRVALPAAEIAISERLAQ